MPFIYYDLAIFAAFCIFVIFFLSIKRSRVKREGILFLYRTKFGLRAIDRIAKKFSRLWGKLGPVIIVAGFVFMALIFILLIKTVFLMFTIPVKVFPIIPLVPYIPQALKLPLPPFYFTYWIIVIAVIAITHEFAHGIFARFHKINVKATGFGFLGPFLLAFVEPDEKKMSRKKEKAQLHILGAGSFSNFIFAIIFLLLLQLFFGLSTYPATIAYAGTAINTTDIENLTINSLQLIEFQPEKISELLDENVSEMISIRTKNETFYIDATSLKAQLAKKELITLAVLYDSPTLRAGMEGEIKKINNVAVKKYDRIFEDLSKLKPGDEIAIETTVSEYKIRAIENPLNKTKGFVGLGLTLRPVKGFLKFIQDAISPTRNPFMFYKSKYNPELFVFFLDLLWWLFIISFFVAIFNMLPVGFLDGGKFIYISIFALTKSKKKAETVFKISSYIVGFIFILLILAWFIA